MKPLTESPERNIGKCKEVVEDDTPFLLKNDSESFFGLGLRRRKECARRVGHKV